MRSFGVARLGLVEFAPRVRLAADLDDLASGVERIVTRIRIGLEIPRVALKHLATSWRMSS
jgi:hypothetical protein